MAGSESKGTKKSLVKGIFGRRKEPPKFSDPDENWQPQAAPPPPPPPQRAPEPPPAAEAAPGGELKELMAKAVAEVEQEQAEAEAGQQTEADTEEKEENEETEQGDDLFDVFTENDEDNPMLSSLAGQLEDVDIYQLLRDCRELADQVKARRDSPG